MVGVEKIQRYTARERRHTSPFASVSIAKSLHRHGQVDLDNDLNTDVMPSVNNTTAIYSRKADDNRDGRMLVKEKNNIHGRGKNLCAMSAKIKQAVCQVDSW